MSVKQVIKKDNIKENLISETKLFQVLNQFNAYELNRLRKFTESPYFNRNEVLIRLLERLNKLIRDPGLDYPTKREVWSEVTKKSTFSDMKFRKLCSDLLKITEKFLMQEMFEANSLQRADNLLVAVYNKRLKDLYNTALNSVSRLSEQYHFRPAIYYYYEYSFERSYYNLSGLELDRSKEANIEQMSSNLDKFYVAEKLRSYITMIDRQSMARHDYQLLFMDEIFAYVESGNLRDEIPINLYYQVYLTRKHPDIPAHFDRLKSLMLEYLKMLPQLEAFEILDSALNYCISRINVGDRAYLREYMEMSVMGIKNELLLVNGVLSPWIFRNIVVTGLRLGDFQWVENFILGYKHQIEEKYRENAVSFNLANLYFYQKRYNDVIKLLQEVEYDDPAYNRNSKTILMATYYELHEFDSLSSLLSSFELYLRRNKAIPESRKKPYIDLIRFMRALLRISERDSQSLLKLRSKVMETKDTVNKEWLLEKIDELLE